MQPQENIQSTDPVSDPNGAFPDLMSENELSQYLRLPLVSSSTNYHNVITNLIRFRHLPRLHIGKKILFPRKAIQDWIDHETVTK